MCHCCNSSNPKKFLAPAADLAGHWEGEYEKDRGVGKRGHNRTWGRKSWGKNGHYRYDHRSWKAAPSWYDHRNWYEKQPRHGWRAAKQWQR